jgi:hypothetical protein
MIPDPMLDVERGIMVGAGARTTVMEGGGESRGEGRRGDLRSVIGGLTGRSKFDTLGVDASEF